MWTKYFHYFQGLRALNCHRTKRSNCVNYRFRWPLQKTFSSSTPPPAWISRVLDPPSRENFQNPIRRGGCGFFLEQPNVIITYFVQMYVLGWQSHQVGDLMTAFYLLLCCVDFVHRKFFANRQNPLGECNSSVTSKLRYHQLTYTCTSKYINMWVHFYCMNHLVLVLKYYVLAWIAIGNAWL